MNFSSVEILSEDAQTLNVLALIAGEVSMPSLPFRQTLTGLSSTAGFPIWFPETYRTPFNIGIGVTANSTAAGTSWNIEHTFDYLGHLSSNFNGFISTAATWFQHSTLAGQSSNANGNYAFPVTGIRLNVTAGASQGQITVTLIQAD